jgi:hypothetical protein
MSTAATNPPDLTPPVTSSGPKKKTPEQVRRIAERRRERKEEARTPRQQAAERTVQDLIWALDRIPDGEEYCEWRNELNRTIHRLRKIEARTPDRDVKAVIKAFASPLNSQGATTADIASDTDIPERDVQKILDGMLSLGTVRCCPKETPEIARGPKLRLYFLANHKPRTNMVLP